MDPPDRTHGENGLASDPKDLIVGTIRPPSWLERIPAPAWLFVGLAVFDAAYRIWQGPFLGRDDFSLSNAASFILSVVAGAATVLLPAAVLVGRRRNGLAESRLLQGAVALAAAELVGLVGRDVVDLVAGPSSLELETPAGMSDFVARVAVIQIPVLLLRIFGLARIGLGLRAISAPSRPPARIVLVIVAGSFAATLLGLGWSIQTFQAQAAAYPLLLTYNLLVVALGLVVFGLWAWIASVAARRESPAWRWMVLGSLAIVLALGLAHLGSILAFIQGGTENAQTILTWFGLAASAVDTLGAVFLVVGFARGLETNRPGESEAPPDAASDSGPIGRPAGT